MKKIFNSIDYDNPLWFWTNPIAVLIVLILIMGLVIYIPIIFFWRKTHLAGWWGYYFKMYKLDESKLRDFHEWADSNIKKGKLSKCNLYLHRKSRIKSWKLIKRKYNQLESGVS